MIISTMFVFSPCVNSENNMSAVFAPSGPNYNARIAVVDTHDTNTGAWIKSQDLYARSVVWC